MPTGYVPPPVGSPERSEMSPHAQRTQSSLAQLAIDGGERTVTSPHPIEWPIYDDAVAERVRKLVIDRKTYHYGRGDEISELEDKFSAYHGGGHSLLVNSGTSAVYSALFGVGIGAGDEVLCPAATFITTVTPLFQLGAVPVLCDCDPETGNLDPEDAATRITGRTRAIVVTHLWGHPAEMSKIMALADKHRLAVVEDCSHAHGARYDGQIVGTFGHAAAFSIGTGKMISGGMAGMVLTRHQDVYDRACLLGHFRRRARETVKTDFYKQFCSTGYGANLRGTPIAAVLALSHFDKIDHLIKEKTHNLERLSAGLAGLAGIVPPVTRPNVTRGAWYGYKARYRPDEVNQIPIKRFAEALQAEGAEIDLPESAPLHMLALFQAEDNGLRFAPDRTPARPSGTIVYKKGDLPVAERIHANSLSFPANKFYARNDALVDEYVAACSKVSEFYAGN